MTLMIFLSTACLVQNQMFDGFQKIVLQMDARIKDDCMSSLSLPTGNQKNQSV